MRSLLLVLALCGCRARPTTLLTAGGGVVLGGLGTAAFVGASHDEEPGPGMLVGGILVVGGALLLAAAEINAVHDAQPDDCHRLRMTIVEQAAALHDASARTRILATLPVCAP